MNEPNDALRFLNITPNWKNAIRSALPSTVSIVDAGLEGNTVRVRLKVPDDRMVNALFRSLRTSQSFADVEFNPPFKDRDGSYIADFFFTFAG